VVAFQETANAQYIPPTPTRLNSTVASCRRRRCVLGIMLYGSIKGDLGIWVPDEIVRTAWIRSVHRTSVTCSCSPWTDVERWCWNAPLASVGMTQANIPITNRRCGGNQWRLSPNNYGAIPQFSRLTPSFSATLRKQFLDIVYAIFCQFYACFQLILEAVSEG